jgi:hypothetical protein
MGLNFYWFSKIVGQAMRRLSGENKKGVPVEKVLIKKDRIDSKVNIARQKVRKED